MVQVFFFFFLYLHIRRGLYYQSYYKNNVWNIGILILLVSMATAFLGYVLPYRQMSYWGATVIINLLSTIPIIREKIVIWIWGRFSVDNATLNRFYSLHYLLPFILIFLIILHIAALHLNRSSNSLKIRSDISKIKFFWYFIIKDLFGIYLFCFFFFFIIFFYSWIFTESDNFIEANSLVTPKHIKPEWYFLFA